MPTRSKPQTQETPSVWLEPAEDISRLEFANRVEILKSLGYYQEHTVDNGKLSAFSVSIQKQETEDLDEISAVLICAAEVSSRIPPAEMAATLRKIEKFPALVKTGNLPGSVEWALLCHYQRGDEVPGTYFPDITWEAPEGFDGTIEQPSDQSIQKAATAALKEHLARISEGRPRNLAHEILAKGLGAIFHRYNRRITRHSSADGTRQQEGGPFFEFVRISVVPLQEFLRSRRLPPVTVSTIVRLAVALRG